MGISKSLWKYLYKWLWKVLFISFLKCPHLSKSAKFRLGYITSKVCVQFWENLKYRHRVDCLKKEVLLRNVFTSELKNVASFMRCLTFSIQRKFLQTTQNEWNDTSTWTIMCGRLVEVIRSMNYLFRRQCATSAIETSKLYRPLKEDWLCRKKSSFFISRIPVTTICRNQSAKDHEAIKSFRKISISVSRKFVYSRELLCRIIYLLDVNLKTVLWVGGTFYFKNSRSIKMGIRFTAIVSVIRFFCCWHNILMDEMFFSFCSMYSETQLHTRLGKCSFFIRRKIRHYTTHSPANSVFIL